MLTNEKLKANARKFYEEGRLGFQNGHKACQYFYEDGARCVIGSSLPASCVKRSDKYSWNEKAASDIDGDLVSFEDASFADSLQEKHDILCSGVFEGSRKNALRRFRRAIGYDN